MEEEEVQENLVLELDVEENIKVQQARIEHQDNAINLWEERIGAVKGYIDDYEERISKTGVMGGFRICWESIK